MVCLTVGDTFDDSLSRDIWKLTRSLINDKSAKITSGAFDVTKSLASHKIIIRTSSEFDSFRSMCLKALDSRFVIARSSAARCFASLLLQLSKLQLARDESVDNQLQSKKLSKSRVQEEDEVEPQRTASPTPSVSSRSSKTVQYFSLSISEGLNTLKLAYSSNTASVRIRSGIIQTYAFVLLSLGSSEIEPMFSQICNSLLVELPSSFNVKSSQYKIIAARKHIEFLFREIILPQLGEVGQVNALKILVNGVLFSKNAHKETIIITLGIVTAFIDSLGPALGPVQESIKEVLFLLISHSKYSIYVTACVCFRSYLNAVPGQIFSTLTHCLEVLNDALENAKQDENLVGYAYLLATIASITNAHSLYTSLELTSRIVTLAISFLKSNGNVTLVSRHVQVGWILLSGPMTLGPDFVKIHLAQFLGLWKSALFKPVLSGKDKISEKGILELNYLMHVRHYALTCMVSFLIHNSKIITPDLSKRISILLQNTNDMLLAIPTKKLVNDDPAQQLDPVVTLQDYVYSTRKRLLQCYVYLYQHNHLSDTFPAHLLTSALSFFADPESNTSSKLSTSIAAGAGSIDSIWETGDNFAYGLTSKLRGYNITELKVHRKASAISTLETVKDEQENYWMSELPKIETIDTETTKSPILNSLTFDIDQVLFFDETDNILKSSLSCVPVITSVVDMSIDIFITVLPFQTVKVQESILDQLGTYLHHGTKSISHGQKNSGKKESVLINSIVTIRDLLKYAISLSQAKKDCFKSNKVLKILIDIIHDAIKDEDPVVRHIASESLGMVCAVGGSAIVTGQIKYLIDEIVRNRDPNARGGCSISLGYILKFVGGMAAGAHIKTILGILVSLSSDPHPLVHFWALEGICITIQSSVMGFSPFASSTLFTLTKLYFTETHGDEMFSVASSNLDVEYPTTRVISRSLQALINVLGPDLQDNQKLQEDIKILLLQFQISENNGLVLEAQRTVQELSIFAPNLPLPKIYLDGLTDNLFNILDDNLREVAINNIYQRMRTNSIDLCCLANKNLENEIWLAFDIHPRNKGIEKIIETWMDLTGMDDSSNWIVRVQQVLVNSRKSFERLPTDRGEDISSEGNNLDLRDEEGTSLGVNNEGFETNTELLKWQTRVLALKLLRKLVNDHLQGKTSIERMKTPVAEKVGDLIKTAFMASTASVISIRLLGLQLLDDLLLGLHDLVDPDFPEVSILEQYQAQISSALTPAFSIDSSPDLALQAIKVSATFIGSGIIKNVERMGRILKILTHALESCTSGTQFALGDLKIFSPNAQVMLRIAVLSLWAELQVSSMYEKQNYLVEVVQSHIPVLVPLWISCLREFARLRFEPEQSPAGLGITGSTDQVYHAMFRTNILPIYQQSWLQLVDAIASLVETDSRLVFDILDEKDRVAVEVDNEEGIQYSNEPAAFFLVLFGLCFEGLIRPQQSFGSNLPFHNGRLRVLIALERILHPAVSGTMIYQDVVFEETIDVFDRLMLTGNCDEQKVVVTIARNLCIHHPGAITQNNSSMPHHDETVETINESVEQLFELFRIVMLGLTTYLPFLSDSSKSMKQISLDNKKLGFIKVCLNNLVDMISVFPRIIQVDLFACNLYVFSRILEDDSVQKTVGSLCLAPQKKLLEFMVKVRQEAIGYQETIDREISTAFSHATILLTSWKRSESINDIPKIKNCILSCVIIVTTGKLYIDDQDPYLADLARIIVDFVDIPQLSIMMIECAKTLLISTVNSPIGRTLSVNILPAFISFATSGVDVVKSKQDIEKKAIPIPKLVNDLLVAYALELDGDQLYTGLALAVPCLLHFVGNETTDIPVETRRYYANQKLLQLVSHNAEAFKNVIQNGLSTQQKAIAEFVLRGDQSNMEEPDDVIDQETHIQLKSFGPN